MAERPPENCLYCYEGMELSLLDACVILSNLEKKHSIGREVYDIRIINDIICAAPTHMVSIFKDHLYFDDPTEYLRRYYNDRESMNRLPKILGDLDYLFNPD